MSALIGLANAAGRIPTITGPIPSHIWRAMGFNAQSALVIVQGGTDPVYFNGSVNVLANGTVLTDAFSAIAVRRGCLPFTANGALAVALAVPVTFSQGIGFTADGRVSIV